MASPDLNDLALERRLPERLEDQSTPFDQFASTCEDAAATPSSLPDVASMFASSAELRADGVEAKPWLVEHLMLRAGLTYLYGDPKAGKTTLLLALLIDAACGRRALGAFDLPEGRPLNILIFSEQPDALSMRLEQVLDPPGPDGRTESRGRIRYFLRKFSSDLATLSDVLKLAAAAAKALEADIIVFDTVLEWARGLGGKTINEAEAMADVGRQFHELATSAACAVVLIHHARKSGGDIGVDMLGSTAIRASSDVNVKVGRVEGTATRVMLCVEARDPERLIRLARGEEKGRNSSWSFDLELMSRPGAEGEKVDYVRYVQVDHDDGASPAGGRLTKGELQELDDRLLSAALESLTKRAWAAKPWAAGDAPPPAGMLRIKTEAERLVSNDELLVPPSYRTPGDSRLRAAKARLVASGGLIKAAGKAGFHLPRWPLPESEGCDLPGLSGGTPSVHDGEGAL